MQPSCILNVSCKLFHWIKELPLAYNLLFLKLIFAKTMPRVLIKSFPSQHLPFPGAWMRSRESRGRVARLRGVVWKWFMRNPTPLMEWKKNPQVTETRM